MENPKQIGIKNDEIIVLSEESDRNYWAKRLGVSCEVLKSAVRATRSIALDKIEAYLNQKAILQITN